MTFQTKVADVLEKVGTFLDISHRISDIQSLDSVLVTLIDMVCEALNAERATLFLNDKETGEFCFNVVTMSTWEQMVDSANGIPGEQSEFDATGLTPIPATKVKAPRIKEAPIHFECKTHQVIELGPNKHPLLIGEVVYFHVDPDVMTGGYIDMKKLDPVGRLNGFWQCGIGQMLERKFEDGQPR